MEHCKLDEEEKQSWKSVLEPCCCDYGSSFWLKTIACFPGKISSSTSNYLSSSPLRLRQPSLFPIIQIFPSSDFFLLHNCFLLSTYAIPLSFSVFLLNILRVSRTSHDQVLRVNCKGYCVQHCWVICFTSYYKHYSIYCP